MSLLNFLADEGKFLDAYKKTFNVLLPTLSKMFNKTSYEYTYDNVKDPDVAVSIMKEKLEHLTFLFIFNQTKDAIVKFNFPACGEHESVEMKWNDEKKELEGVLGNGRRYSYRPEKKEFVFIDCEHKQQNSNPEVSEKKEERTYSSEPTSAPSFASELRERLKAEKCAHVKNNILKNSCTLKALKCLLKNNLDENMVCFDSTLPRYVEVKLSQFVGEQEVKDLSSLDEVEFKNFGDLIKKRFGFSKVIYNVMSNPFDVIFHLVF